MDLPSKATARSKWRSSQSHKPHSRPASSVPGKPSKAALESNFDRYEEEEVDARPGQARLSQGEDLAALLRDAEGLQQAARHRTPLPAEPEIELLESALQGKEPQGLTLDMEALAQALCFIPLHEVLGLDQKYFPNEPEAQPSLLAGSAAGLDSDAALSTLQPHAPSPGPAPASVGAPARDAARPQSSAPSKPALSEEASRRPISQLATQSDADQHAASTPMATAQAAEAQENSGAAHSVEADKRGRAAAVPASTTLKSDGSSSSRPQQAAVHNPASMAIPPSTPHSSSSQSSNSQLLQPSSSKPAVVFHASGAKTGVPSKRESQHAAPGSLVGRASQRTTGLAAAKPSPASAAAFVAADDDDGLDALLGMGGAEAPASGKQQKGSGKDDDDDLDALLGLGDHGSRASSQPQKGCGGASGPRHKPGQNESLESFLDSL